MNPILKVSSIKKDFGAITAVNELSFSVERGEIFALLGPNGAGKTTTVRMLMDIIKPDTGSIEYFIKEGSFAEMPLPSELGYLPEERGLYQEISIMKTLEYMGIIRGMGKGDAGKQAEVWLEKLELLDRKNEKLNTLSKGNQQKIQFISSILHKPAFAILDEPFSGLDPINQEAFLEIIRELRNCGTTVLLSAHQMQLVEKIADKAILINKGRSIASGTVKEIIDDSFCSDTILISYEGDADLSFLDKEDAIEKCEKCDESAVRIYLRKERPLSGLLRSVSENMSIKSVKTEHLTLHDVFINKVLDDSERKNEK